MGFHRGHLEVLSSAADDRNRANLCSLVTVSCLVSLPFCATIGSDTDAKIGRRKKTHGRVSCSFTYCAEVDTSVARILIGFPIPISQGKIQCPSFQLMIPNFSYLISHFQFLISHSLFLPSHYQLLVSHFMEEVEI